MDADNPKDPAHSRGRWIAGPAVFTYAIIGRQDRLFPAAWLGRIVQERLGIAPDEIDSGHCPALSQPHELARRLEGHLATPPHARLSPE